VGIINVAERANEFKRKIKESIKKNVVFPYGEVEFEDKKASIAKVFECVKTVLKREPGMFRVVYGTNFQDLMKKEAYREEMVVFTDLIILVVDTMAEANVELFGNVVGITKVVQEMFRKYVGK
jgi:predicted SpoU family rRNA methylase